MGSLCLSTPKGVVPGCWKGAEIEILRDLCLEVWNKGVSRMAALVYVWAGSRRGRLYYFLALIFAFRG